MRDHTVTDPASPADRAGDQPLYTNMEDTHQGEYVGECTWCETDVWWDATDGPAGDALVWKSHTGDIHAFCTLHHQVEWFQSVVGERIELDERPLRP